MSIAFLETLGEERAGFERAQAQKYGTAIENVLNKFGIKVVKELQQNIKNKKIVSTGELSSSISYKVIEISAGRYSFRLSIASYYKFVDKGVKGRESAALAPTSPYQFTKKNLPRGIVLSWMGYKNINALNKPAVTRKGKPYTKLSKVSNISAQKSLAYVIGRSITQRGLRTTNFYTDVINDETLAMLKKAITKALKTDVIIQLRQ
jgi:hypothetical protein